MGQHGCAASCALQCAMPGCSAPHPGTPAISAYQLMSTCWVNLLGACHIFCGGGATVSDDTRAARSRFKRCGDRGAVQVAGWSVEAAGRSAVAGGACDGPPAGPCAEFHPSGIQPLPDILPETVYPPTLCEPCGPPPRPAIRPAEIHATRSARARRAAAAAPSFVHLLLPQGARAGPRPQTGFGTCGTAIYST